MKNLWKHHYYLRWRTGKKANHKGIIQRYHGFAAVLYIRYWEPPVNYNYLVHSVGIFKFTLNDKPR
jgi:hypothetical protein